MTQNSLDAVEALMPVLETDFFDEEVKICNSEIEHVAGYAAANLLKSLKRESEDKECYGHCGSFFIAKKGEDIIDHSYRAYLQLDGPTVATDIANLLARYLEVMLILS